MISKNTFEIPKKVICAEILDVNLKGHPCTPLILYLKLMKFSIY